MGAASKTGQVKFLVQGEQGPSGARQRYVDWSTTSDFLSGTNGEEWQYTTYYNTHAYLCLRSFNKSTYSKTPAQSVADNDGYFIVADEFFFAMINYLIVNKINAAMIDVQNLIVEKVRTAASGPRIEMSGTMMEIFGNSVANIRSGINADGLAVLEYYDNDGRKLYDLGPSGINQIPVSEESWSDVYLKYLGTSLSSILTLSAEDYKTITYYDTVIWYQYHSQVVAGVVDDTTNDTLIFASKNKTSNKINGWYVSGLKSVNGVSPIQQIRVSNPDYHICTSSDLSGLQSENETVRWQNNIYCVALDHYTDGVNDQTVLAYWNGGDETDPLI